MIIKRLLLLSTFFFLAGHINQSHAIIIEETYYFNGTCSDCVLNDDSGLIGTLVLENYTEGDAITFANFVSFTYVGSDIVDPFTVLPGSVGSVGGVIGTSFAAPYDFFVDYDDGLRFETFQDGSWYTCGNGDYYYSGTCDYLNNDDLGPGTWAQTPGAIPLPAAAWLFGSALLGLGVIKRKKA